MAKRKKPKVRAQTLFLEHLTKWEKHFRARVAKIAPGMVRAETKKMQREADALHAVHPGAISDSFHEQYKASMKELIEVQQTGIAAGRVFREFFADIEPLALDAYLGTQTMNAAWLVGFSNNKAVLQRYEREVRQERAAALRPVQLAGAKANRVKAMAKALRGFKNWRSNQVRRHIYLKMPRPKAVGSYIKQARPTRREKDHLETMLATRRAK